MKFDGHVHSPYCPHGSSDMFEEYIEQAINQEYTEISFTEHAPLPTSFTDPTPKKDSGMAMELFEEYISTLQKLKQQYRHKIKLNIGLEVDFIEGYEEETKKFLNQYGSLLDDSILSVHFLKKEQHYYCIDYSPEEFGRIIKIFDSIENVYSCYFSTLKRSILADLGKFKPKRIGHITLVNKFQKCYTCTHIFEKQICEILQLLKNGHLQLDYNGAGAIKPFCLEPYPPEWVVKKAIGLGIPLVYGSDAHSAKGINQGYDQLYQDAILVSPTIR